MKVKQNEKKRLFAAVIQLNVVFSVHAVCSCTHLLVYANDFSCSWWKLTACSIHVWDNFVAPASMSWASAKVFALMKKWGRSSQGSNPYLTSNLRVQVQCRNNSKICVFGNTKKRFDNWSLIHWDYLAYILTVQSKIFIHQQ